MPARLRRPRRILIRRDAMRRLARDKLNLKTDVALADQLGVDHGDMSRYLHGRRLPNSALIASILDLYDEPFEVLFEVRPVSSDTTHTTPASTPVASVETPTNSSA